LRRHVVAVVVAVAAMNAWSAAAVTQEFTAKDAIDPPAREEVSEPVQNPALVEQAQRAEAQLLDHHAQVEDLRERMQQNSLEHHERTKAALGDRAPTATIAPMATIAPVETGG
jgi:hypothetical protein